MIKRMEISVTRLPYRLTQIGGVKFSLKLVMHFAGNQETVGDFLHFQNFLPCQNVKVNRLKLPKAQTLGSGREEKSLSVAEPPPTPGGDSNEILPLARSAFRTKLVSTSFMFSMFKSVDASPPARRDRTEPNLMRKMLRWNGGMDLCGYLNGDSTQKASTWARSIKSNEK